jgi:transposase
MSEVSTIGLDIAKQVFQVHGADASGHVMFRKALGARDRQVGPYGRFDTGCLCQAVREAAEDAADAEAICEAAQRPSMRFVAVKDEAQ